MRAKEYLEQISMIKIKVKLKRENIEELKGTIEGVKGLEISERVQTSPKGDPIGDSVIRLERLESELNDYIEKYDKKYKEIMSTMEELTNKDYYNVLYRRYVLEQSWEQIAVNMNYTSRGTQKLHGRALQEIEKILKSVRTCS